MKKFLLFYLLIALLFSTCTVPAAANNKNDTVGQLEEMIDSIVAWKQKTYHVSSADKLINVGLAKDAGTGPAEWYVMGLRQYRGENTYNGYNSQLDAFIKTQPKLKETDKQRIALAYSSTGGGRQFVLQTLDSTIGKMGIMSYIYGLILMDSGAYTRPDVTRDSVIRQIVSLQLADGGWNLMGKYSDVDVTAMAIQALAPYYAHQDVKTAINQAINLLSKRQLENGDYSSMGVRNAESVAQVICALTALNIDPQTDRRFIKNGNSLLDGLLLYRTGEGGYSHLIGTNVNDTSTSQAMHAFIAMWRQAKNLGPLFRFTDQVIQREPTMAGSTTSTTVKVPTSVGIQGDTSSTTPGAATTVNASGTSNSITTKKSAGNTSAEETESTVAASTAVLSPTDPAQNKGGGLSGKVVACGVILLIAAALVCWMLIKKKCHIKNLLTLAAAVILAFVGVFCIKIQSVEEYYQVNIDTIKEDSQTVFISIRCDTVLGKLNADYLPKNGVILDKTEYVLRDGDTVFDMLSRTVKHNAIPLDYEGSADNAMSNVYVKGIQYLYESDCGDLSGWMYKVNGQMAKVACSEYKLKDGDVIEWVYSCDLGKDVGGE